MDRERLESMFRAVAPTDYPTRELYAMWTKCVDARSVGGRLTRVELHTPTMPSHVYQGRVILGEAVSWVTGRRRGHVRSRRWFEICIYRDFGRDRRFLSDAIVTLIHEVAHVVANRRGHGRHWRQAARMIACEILDVHPHHLWRTDTGRAPKTRQEVDACLSQMVDAWRERRQNAKIAEIREMVDLIVAKREADALAVFNEVTP